MLSCHLKFFTRTCTKDNGRPVRIYFANLKQTKAVIVVLHAISLGLAIDIACAADIRLCTRDVRLAVKEVDIGLAADIGTLSRLPKAVGNFSWVKEVCLSAREFGSAEAQQVGFVSHVLDSKGAAMDQAVKLAGLIAGKSPIAVQGTKELLNHARDHSVAESMSLLFLCHSFLALIILNVKLTLLIKACGIPPSGTRLLYNQEI